jgi:hypothetical protein
LIQKYVDLDSGSDSNGGTSGAPYLTLQHAIEQHSSASGTEFLIRGSVSNQLALDFTIGNIPTITNPLVLRDWPGNPRPSIDFGVDQRFQTDASTVSVTSQNIDYSFQGNYPGNIFNIETTSTGMGFSGCTLDSTGITAQGNTGFGIGAQGHLIDCHLKIGICNGAIINSGSVISGCLIESSQTQSCITMHGGSSAIGNVVVLESGDGFAGISLSSGEDQKIIDNILVCPAGGLGDGVRISSTSRRNVVISGNYVEGFNVNFLISATGLPSLSNNVSVNPGSNHFTNPTGKYIDPTNVQLSSASDSLLTGGAVLPYEGINASALMSYRVDSKVVNGSGKSWNIEDTRKEFKKYILKARNLY